MDKKIIDRVSEELKKAGVKSPALIKLESKSLANILYPDEFIGGAVHGAYSGGLAWLIATNKRIIFMDKKPFFNREPLLCIPAWATTILFLQRTILLKNSSNSSK